jgi:hypothetical protein
MTTVNLKLEWRERQGYREGAIWLYAGPFLVAHIFGRCDNGCFIGYPLGSMPEGELARSEDEAEARRLIEARVAELLSESH